MALAVGMLILATALPHSGQTPSKSMSENEHARRSVAVNTLRAINTAEYEYKSVHGTFVAWEVLMVSDQFRGRGLHLATLNEPQLMDAHFSSKPEILPGWALRLNVSSDGKAYDVLLEDLNDKTCGYAAITNETGLIRQSKNISCEL
jgi:hypothetical protein